MPSPARSAKLSERHSLYDPSHEEREVVNEAPDAVPEAPAAPERRAGEWIRAALGEDFIECLVEAVTERVRVKDDDQKRPRKPAAASPQDGRHERKADRLCEAFADTLPGDKGSLLLAAAQENNLFLTSEDAAYLDAFERAFFENGAGLQILKSNLAWLFTERDNFGSRTDRLPDEDARSSA